MRQSAVETGLKNKGFVRCDGRHRRFVFMTDTGRKTPVKTMTSHGPDKILCSSLVSKMARECQLTTPEFEKMVSCRIPRDEYTQLLRLKGIDTN